MSKPSFSNIDRWLFELQEGNLSPEQIQQLKVFLLNHPEFDVDKDAWDLAYVKKEEVVYPQQGKFHRRRPVGLYMSAGFTAVSIFIAIGINLIANQNDFSYATLLSKMNEKSSELVSQEKSYSNPNQSSKTVNGQNSNLITQDNWETENQEGEINPISRLGIAGNVFDAQIVNLADFSVSPSNFHSSSRSAQIHNSVDALDLRVAKEIDVFSKKEEKQSGNTIKEKKATSGFTKLMRKLRRMMDQSVALKNMRDPNFMVPGLSALDVNFSTTGSLPVTRIQSMTRYQWAFNANEQWVNQLSYDSYIYGLRGGIGVQLNNGYYHNGQIMNSNIALTYSPKIAISKSVLFEPSMRFKMGSKMLFENKIDGTGIAEFDRQNAQEFYPVGITPNGKQLWYRDLGLGFMLNTKWFYVGVQGDNLLRHYDNIYSGENASERRVGTHFVATLGTDYLSKKETFAVSPYVLYQKTENLEEAWLGVNSRIDWFTIGGAVSNHYDVVANLGLKFKRFGLGLQADYTHSQMFNKKLLSYQINLKVITFNPNRKQKLINF